MSKVLVKFDADWADEFSVNGFEVVDKEKWEASVEEFKNAKSFCGFWFGTNEGWDSCEIEEERNNWLSNYEVIDISDEEAAVLEKLFKPMWGKGLAEFGHIRLPHDLVDEIGD